MFGFDRAFAQSRKSAANLVGHHKHAGTTRVAMSVMAQSGHFLRLKVSGYTNVIPPAGKTKKGMEMSKKCGGSTVSRLACGEV